MMEIDKNIMEEQPPVPAPTPVPPPPPEPQQNTVSKFFSHIMSVDETRISVLMICLLASVIFGGVMYKIVGSIDHNWVDVIETFAFCVTGINIASALGNGNSILSKIIKK